MPRNPENTTELVEMLVRALVDDQENVSVVAHDEGTTTVIEVSVAQEETGKVIGRQGKTIKAIRTLARASVDSSVEVEVLG